MPFNHTTAAQKIDMTSCGFCTAAWGLKMLAYGLKDYIKSGAVTQFVLHPQ